MSQDQFQARIARIQQRRASEKAAGAPVRPTRVAAVPQGTPEGFKVPRKQERKGETVAFKPGLQGLFSGILGAALFLIVSNQHADALSMGMVERAEYILSLLQDPDAPADALPLVFLFCAVLFAVAAQPVIGFLAGGWGGVALIVYVSAFLLGAAGMSFSVGEEGLLSDSMREQLSPGPAPEAQPPADGAPQDTLSPITEPVAPQRPEGEAQ